MHKFGEFADPNIFVGKKIKIDSIIDQDIQVIKYKLTNSKYEKGMDSKCLVLQIKYNEEDRIVFTGSAVLAEQIERYENQLPFETRIIKPDSFYSFS